VATVAIEGMAFITPVHVGAVVSCYCDVIEIGRSSIRIMVEVWINSPHDGEPIKVTEGRVRVRGHRRTAAHAPITR
jgi:acyl-CoA thioesterase YciA